MTEEELRKFWEARKRTPGTIQSILEGNSPESASRQAKERHGVELSKEEAEQIAARWRQEFADNITVFEVGGAVWNAHEQTYMFRSEFPPDEENQPHS